MDLQDKNKLLSFYVGLIWHVKGYARVFLVGFTFIFPGRLLSASRPGQHLYQDSSSPQDRVQIQSIRQKTKNIQGHDPESAIKLLRSGLTLARKLHYRYGEALMFSGFADINERYRNDKMALKYRSGAISLFLQVHRIKEATDAEIFLARLYGKMHELNKSSELLSINLKRSQNSKDIQGQLQALIALGYVNALNKNYQQALFYNQEAYGLLKGKSVDTTNFVVLQQLAQVHEQLGEARKALDYYELAIQQSNRRQFAAWHVTLLRKAGELWDKTGDPIRAGIMHKQSLQKARDFMMPEQEARSQMSFAFSLSDKDALQSIEHFKRALSISQSIGSASLTAEIFQGLANLYQQQANYKQAMLAIKQHQHLLDSLKTVEGGYKLSLLEGSFELAENKIYIQNLELSANKRIAQRNLEVIVMISLFFLLGFMFIYYLKTKALNQRLSLANVTKDKLFSIIGHDLRNPIGGIVQLLDLVDQEAEDAGEVRQMVRLMKLQGNNALEILNALLKWGETQLTTIKVEPTIFNPQYFIYRNIDLFGKQISDKGLLINSQIPANLNLMGDANHFDFIVRNLLSNAIKFSFPNGQIAIFCSKVKNQRWQFSIQDHGKGVSLEQQRQFQNANMDVSFGTGGEKGTGLGLLLSKEFARVNGDNLSLKSTPGAGASFSFSFKAAHK